MNHLTYVTMMTDCHKLLLLLQPLLVNSVCTGPEAASHLQLMLLGRPISFVKPPELLAVLMIQCSPGVVQYGSLTYGEVMRGLGHQLAVGRGLMCQLDVVLVNSNTPCVHLTHPTCRQRQAARQTTPLLSLMVGSTCAVCWPALSEQSQTETEGYSPKCNPESSAVGSTSPVDQL